MGATKLLSPRQRAFIDFYIQLSNGREAAIKAGYSAHTASNRAYKLLRTRRIQDELGGRKIVRGQHAEHTYQNLIRLADKAMEEAAVVCGWDDDGVQQTRHMDPLARVRAIEAAGKAVGRLAKVEGLLVERVEVDGGPGLMSLLEIARKFRAQLKAAIPLPGSKGKEIEAALVPPGLLGNQPANGNSHKEGEGHGEVLPGQSPAG